MFTNCFPLLGMVLDTEVQMWTRSGSGGTWVAQLVKRPTLIFGSVLDLMGGENEPCIRLCTHLEFV